MGLTCPLWFLDLISSKNSQRWRFWVIAIFWANIWLIFWQVTDFGHLPAATCQKSAKYWSEKSRSPKIVIFDNFSMRLSREIKVGTSVPRTSLIEHVQAHYRHTIFFHYEFDISEHWHRIWTRHVMVSWHRHYHLSTPTGVFEATVVYLFFIYDRMLTLIVAFSQTHRIESKVYLVYLHLTQ